jgi:transcriptional regulator with XRE-family HTH domain
MRKKKGSHGQWVREARQHKGWTQAQLAQAMDVTAPNVSHWENDVHRVSYDQLQRISHLTGHALPEIDWPLPNVPFQRIANLSPPELQALQVVMLSVLKAMETTHSFDEFLAALQPSPSTLMPKT